MSKRTRTVRGELYNGLLQDLPRLWATYRALGINPQTFLGKLPQALRAEAKEAMGEEENVPQAVDLEDLGTDAPPILETKITTDGGSIGSTIGGGGATTMLKETKRGPVTTGMWAQRQKNAKRKYIKADYMQWKTHIIKYQVGCVAFQLPCQPWHSTSKFQELAPNGICLGVTRYTQTTDAPSAVNTYANSNLTTGMWYQQTGAFRNTCQWDEQAEANSATAPPRNYNENELEYPFINVVENKLRLQVRPGSSVATIRLLVIQILTDEDTAIEDTTRDLNQYAIGDFFNLDERIQKEASPPSVNRYIKAINGFMRTSMSAMATQTPFRVITDKVWTMTPGDTSSRQVPLSLEINHPHSNVALTVGETETDGNQWKIMNKGRIIWGMFYQVNGNEDLAPTVAVATTDAPSYCGDYRFKWKLQKP